MLSNERKFKITTICGILCNLNLSYQQWRPLALTTLYRLVMIVAFYVSIPYGLLYLFAQTTDSFSIESVFATGRSVPTKSSIKCSKRLPLLPLVQIVNLSINMKVSYMNEKVTIQFLVLIYQCNFWGHFRKVNMCPAKCCFYFRH